MDDILTLLGIKKAIAIWAAIGSIVSMHFVSSQMGFTLPAILGVITSLSTGWLISSNLTAALVELYPMGDKASYTLAFFIGIFGMAATAGFADWIRTDMRRVISSWLKRPGG